MSSSTENGGLSFDLPKNKSNVIKVIGVGGGGSNAINHMFKSGIVGVDFVICNTDAQALNNSPVPNKIQLGVSLTEGLGAGADPIIGEESAIESFDSITAMLDTNTKMVFITAGMGGGTGTGAAPIIAKMAKEAGVLTVGIVTVPFVFEGKKRNEQAQIGVEKLRKEVDSLIVINNNKLREVYGNLGFKAGFAKADEVLATAAKSIAEVITHHYIQNIDLRDARTVLENGGSAIMGSAVASGAGRALEAVSKALDSPLLNDNKITGAKNVLLLILSGTEEITMDEMGEINEYIQAEAGQCANIIQGVGEDENLADGAISVTVVATGFESSQQDTIVNTETKKIIHALEDNQAVTQVLSAKNVISEIKLPTQDKKIITEDQAKSAPKIVHELFEEEQQSIETPTADLVPTTEVIENIDVVCGEIVAPSSAIEEEFVITETVKDEIVENKTSSIEDEQITLSFDLPIAATDDLFEPLEEKKIESEAESVVNTSEKIILQLEDDVADIEVNSPTEVVSVTEQTEQGMIKYTVDVEEEKKEINQVSKDSFVIHEKLQEKKPQVTQEEVVPDDVEVDPANLSIEETNRLIAEGRKRNVFKFNYKFRSNLNKNIEELEKQPAYKRKGIDLTEPQTDGNLSKTTLSSDDNDDIQLRSGNSFLHDNVD